MLTKEDKSWIVGNFVTGREFNTKFEAIETVMLRNEGKLDKIMTMLDGFTGKVADLEQENKMGAITLHRHGIQIHELAKATGTKLSR